MLRILVRPGLYRESVSLDREVEIVADGAKDQVVIESVEGPCIVMKAEKAVVRGLTLRGRAGSVGKQYYAVDVPQGCLRREDCDITSNSLACVAIHGSDATPTILNCKIHDGKESGVFVYEQGKGTIEDCDIFANKLAGVQIQEGGNPAVCRCQITDNGGTAVFVHHEGRGTIEGCRLQGNEGGAWDIASGCRVRRRNNQEC